ncbi:MFS transporter, partial [Leucobacter sp. M11]|uniref:MFS transporter n=1 Tax=Leucobacter sp. M11 TaxID=2993565 RepID=UPI002D7E189A
MPKPSLRQLPFEVWALVAGGFVIALGYGVVAPVLPQFAREFNVSFTAASAIVSAFALMRLVFAPAAGWVVGKVGERKTYIVGLLIVAVSTGACALAVNYPQLLVLRSLGGIGSTMFSIAATGLLIKVSPIWARGRVASVNAAGFLLGNLLGPVLGALVAGWGLRAPFVLYFVTLVLAAVVVGFSLRNSVHVQPGSGNGEPAGRSLREALRLSQYRAVLLSGFAHGWSSFGVRVSVIPLFIGASLGESASAAGWALAAYAAGNALFIFPSGRWNDTVGRKPMILTGLLLAGLSFAVLPFST